MKKLKKQLTILLFFVAFSFIKISAQTVYITESGKKYHAKNCSLAKTGKKGISLSEAKKQGYEACKLCIAKEIKAIEEKEKKSKTSNSTKK
jgi:predicted RNase H-like HicB family nuclease